MILWLAATVAWADPLADRDADLVRPDRETGCPASVRELVLPDGISPDDPRLSGPALIVVRKEARRAVLYREGQRALAADGSPACWWVGLAPGYPAGHKQRMGDLKTPEGFYRTSDRPWSSFYHALTVDYPGPADAERGLRDGLIDATQRDAIVAAHRRGVLPPMDTRLGGKILLHGGGGRSDWTLGCVALDDTEIDALRALLPESLRTDVLILP